MISFTENLIMDNFGYAYGLNVADLDGDGHIDITAADGDSCALCWFKNDGKGNFTRCFIQRDHPKPRLERHAIGDINQNGHLDIVIVENLTGDIYWFENNGHPTDGQLWTCHDITIGGMPFAYDIALGDLNGNGLLDVAASGQRSGQIAWFKNPGTPDGLWTKHLLDDTMVRSRTIRIADLDNDGFPDLLATGTDVIAWYKNPCIDSVVQWQKHIIDNKTPQPVHGHPIDINDNGNLDVVMACGMGSDPSTGSVLWYENTGNLSTDPWTKHTICNSFPQAFEAFAADVDNDGNIEVVVTAWGDTGGLYHFKNKGDPYGPWQKQTLKENWPKANQIVIADLTSNGSPDIIAQAERGSNGLRWWKNGGLEI